MGMVGLLSSADDPGWRGSVHVGYGYGALAAAAADGMEEEQEQEHDDEDAEAEGEVGCGCCCRGRRWKGRMKRAWRWLGDTWVDPKASVVQRVVDAWWSRWAALVVLPALLVRTTPSPSPFPLSLL
jgi:hypothetical protein